MIRPNYQALAIDGDGTLLYGGRMGRGTISALERWRRAGRKLLLVTGENVRQVAEFPHADLFDRIQRRGMNPTPHNRTSRSLMALT